MPEIPFRNAYSGPAGEYSDNYQAIVDQYRDEVDSARNLRRFQEDKRAINTGLVPPSVLEANVAMRGQRSAPTLRTPNNIYKSGDDIIRIDQDTGQPSVIYHHPAAAPPALKPPNPGYTTRTYEVPEVADVPAQAAKQNSFMGIDWLWPDTPAREAVKGHPAQKITERVLNEVPPMNPQPALTIPQADAPVAAPRSRFYAGGKTSSVDEHGFPLTAGIEAANGSYMGSTRPLAGGSPLYISKNALAAPPNTTQNQGVRIKVISPDGKPGTLPEYQLDFALKNGWKRR